MIWYRSEKPFLCFDKFLIDIRQQSSFTMEKLHGFAHFFEKRVLFSKGASVGTTNNTILVFYDSFTNNESPDYSTVFNGTFVRHSYP